MTVSLEFGIGQAVVHADLELASVRGNQGQALDIVLEFLEQVVCQAHGPVGVMSNSAVDDFDVYHCSPSISSLPAPVPQAQVQVGTGIC